MIVYICKYLHIFIYLHLYIFIHILCFYIYVISSLFIFCKNKKTVTDSLFAVNMLLYRSFLNILKQPHVTSSKNLHTSHYKIVNSYKVKESLKSSRVIFVKRSV